MTVNVSKTNVFKVPSQHLQLKKQAYELTVAESNKLEYRAERRQTEHSHKYTG